MAREKVARPGTAGQPHSRNGSGAATVSTNDFADMQHPHPRRLDHDAQSIETDVSGSRPSAMKNPIPAPTVTVRSEFPTLNRSRQQQSLTCLVTIEVPPGKWRPHLGNLQSAPPIPPLPQDDPQSSVQSPGMTHNVPDMEPESPEVLAEITEELRTRVDNWHGLEFSR